MSEKLTERITELEIKLYGIERNLEAALDSAPMYRNRSKEIGKLVVALGKAKLEYGDREEVKAGIKIKYATFETILDAVEPALERHGLLLHQGTSVDGDYTIIHTSITHSSDQWIASQIRIPSPRRIEEEIDETKEEKEYIDTIKGEKEFAASQTCHLRYAARTLLGIPSSEGNDSKDSTFLSTKTATTTLSSFRAGVIEKLLIGLPDVKERMLKKYNVTEIKDLLDSHYFSIKNAIELHKNQIT